MSLTFTCKHCGGPAISRQSACGGRPIVYCAPRCRVAAMRKRKAEAGLIPRAPWQPADRDRYYTRQQRRNRYANPNAGSVAPTLAEYMQRNHHEEWALRSALRNAGPESRSATGMGNVTPAGGCNVTRARRSKSEILNLKS